MITTPNEYNEKLWLIQSKNPPRKAILPHAENRYEIDLKTRKINSPEFLSIQKDHRAESVYFIMPRYLDYMDLAETTGVIQYKLVDGTIGIYPIPFYDITSENTYGNEKIIFPWLLSGEATALSGPIEYSIRFFKIEDLSTTEEKKFKFLYNLNTIPATSKILYGMDVQSEDLNGKFDVAPTIYDAVLAALDKMQKQDIYWIEIK